MNTLSAHMIIKNGVKYDYPFLESCLSILPICDEFVFVDGNSEDGTYEALLELQKTDSRIKVYRHTWEKKHYSVLSDLTNVAIDKCTSTYHFQIQADEILHEKYHGPLLKLVRQGGFDYAFLGVVHFFGSFKKIYKPTVYYDRFIRLASKSSYPAMRSYDDAMTLGTPDSDPNKWRRMDADHIIVNHYGYVRKPKALIEKQDIMHEWWGIKERDAIFQEGVEKGKIIWGNKHPEERLTEYTETHPSVLLDWMKERENMVEQGIV